MDTITPWTRRAAGWTGVLAIAAASLLMAGCERRDAADTGNATGTTGGATDSTTGTGSMGSTTTTPSGTTGTPGTGTPGSTDTITPPMDPASAPMPAASQ
ncbi:hypothetical protein [Ideonella sp.]|uniref:hypothetical protein n=1 Tax=Ideonella sp. TaxID=1929293 RepID=UPI0035B481A1